MSASLGNRFLAVLPAATGEVSTDPCLDTLASLVGGFQVDAQLIGRVLHADLIEAGDGEQFDVLLGQRPPGGGERGQGLVEEGVDVIARCVSVGGFGFDRKWPDGLGASRLLAFGVGDAALDEPDAEVRGTDVDLLQSTEESVDQVVIDVGGVVAVGQCDALAGTA